MLTVNKSLLTLNQDIAGQEIGIPVYRLTSESSSAFPVVYIQSAVHAAEMQGSAVIYHLIQLLQKVNMHCNVILVPNCNPFGRTQRAGEYLQGRFDATTGNNWNRFYFYQPELAQDFVGQFGESSVEHAELESTKHAFKAFLSQQIDIKMQQDWGINTAQFLNLTLQKMAVEADIVLDLHTGPSSTRHIYSPDYLAETARHFNIENILSIPTKFAGALDEATFSPWVDLVEQFPELGLSRKDIPQAFTIELGSQENICLTQAYRDALGILNYLQAMGLISDAPSISSVNITTTPLSSYKTLYSKHAGMVEYLAKAGDRVSIGQVIARVLNSLEFDSGKAIIDICSPADGTVILHYPSAAVQVGTQLYKIAMSQNTP